MSRNNEFFHACKVDNWYIFEHTEYEWDDIVNAFIKETFNEGKYTHARLIEGPGMI